MIVFQKPINFRNKEDIFNLLTWEYVDRLDVIFLPGIYILQNNGSKEYEYVGKSSKIGSRLQNHHHVYQPDIHDILITFCAKSDFRDLLEYQIINILNPKLNKKSGYNSYYKFPEFEDECMRYASGLLHLPYHGRRPTPPADG